VAIRDADRRVIHEGLVRAMGTDAADVFMEHLPHDGWPDFATKQDVRVSAAELRAELRGEISKQTRTIMLGLVGMTMAMVGSVFGAVASVGH
jgi:hypothetical protein